MIGLGGMGRLNVGIAVHLRDEFSTRAQNIHSKMQLLYGDADELLRRNSRALDDLGTGAMVAGAGLTMFAYGAVKELANYEKSVSMLKASIGSDMDIAFQNLEDRIKQTAIESRYSIEETTMAATELARAGYKASQIYQMIGAATNLGQAGDIPIVTAADALGRVLNTYDMAAESASYVSDKIAIAANKSDASVISLMESLKYSGDILKSTGVPFETAIALFARLGSAGLRGSIAGTSVANMLRYLNKAATDLGTGKQSKALAMLGLGKQDLLDENGQLKQLIGVDGKKGLLEILGERLRQLEPSKAQAIAEAMMGVRGERAFIPLMEITKNVRSLEDLYKVIKEGPPGSAENFSKQLMNNLWGDLDRLRENWTAFLLKFAGNKGVREFVQLLTRGVELLTRFIDSPIGSIFSKILFYGGPILVMLGSMTWMIQRFARFTMMAKEGMFGLSQTLRHQASSGLSRYFGGIGGPGQSLYAQNLRANSAGIPYMGPGGGIFGGRQYQAGSMLTSAHRASLAPYTQSLQAVQIASASAATGTMGAASALSATARIASRAMGVMTTGVAAIGPIIDLMEGRMGGAFGGILGGILGFAAGGPMGALMGSMMGQSLGGFFDSERQDAYSLTTPDERSGTSFSMGPDGTLYREKTPTQVSNPNPVYNNVNVNIDGYNVLSKRYENETNENVYSLMGGY
jgi:TP901 family phage tail tape measure protein